MDSFFKTIFSILLIISLFFSCRENKKTFFTKNFTHSQWPKDQELVFNFFNPTPGKKYDVFYQISYSPEYPFQNLWMRHQIEGPDGKALSEANSNMDLFDRISGKPEGQYGAGKIYRYARFQKNISLKDSGLYKIRIRQYMRADTLEGIISAGIVLSPEP